ncbi:SidA/IucD/PvdA family monooxygenase [Mesorhizobium caraganae]|uniref:SidA/IucD/PvdA family monooxygenase n=1 Tax=Mesorhizobium caraganae TaxID=483206 RepID=UPI001785C6E5|nr:SidA/IucD/PvdA family monooxygenase [Mesorhizobium caraganae]
MPQQNVAVIGAGPKAAAIAAKAYCLQQEGKEISVTVFERSEVGANWSGRHGYTDGIQRLCTPAERDLGFPYLPTFGSDVAALMQERFSWNAYLVSQVDAGARYADWVNRGRRPPTHADFSAYLDFAFKRAITMPAIGRVTKLIRDGAMWKVRQIDAATKDVLEFPDFHGVVFTGPGPASRKPPQVKDLRVLSGVDFWSNLARVRKVIEGLKDNPIIIIGGGGTAAAITAWFIRQGFHDQPIVLLNNQAMLFTRTTNFFENSLFDDEETWLALKPDDRTDFTRRLNRGVVWETVTQLLTDARNLTLVPGTATQIRHGATPKRGKADLEVEYGNQKGTHTMTAGLVVDATGFDPWAFEALLPDDMRLEVAPANTKALMRDMRSDLSIPLDDWPRIHLPNLADALGPGFGSLMVLGAMADRILQPYYDLA